MLCRFPSPAIFTPINVMSPKLTRASANIGQAASLSRGNKSACFNLEKLPVYVFIYTRLNPVPISLIRSGYPASIFCSKTDLRSFFGSAISRSTTASGRCVDSRNTNCPSLSNSPRSTSFVAAPIACPIFFPSKHTTYSMLASVPSTCIADVCT